MRPVEWAYRFAARRGRHGDPELIDDLAAAVLVAPLYGLTEWQAMWRRWRERAMRHCRPFADLARPDGRDPLDDETLRAPCSDDLLPAFHRWPKCRDCSMRRPLTGGGRCHSCKQGAFRLGVCPACGRLKTLAADGVCRVLDCPSSPSSYAAAKARRARATA